MSINNPIQLTGTLANTVRLTGTFLTTSEGLVAPAATSFLALTDTPNSYAGMAGYAVVVNVGEDGLEFIESGDAADIQAAIDAATELDPPTDVTRFATTLAGVLRFVRLDSIKTALTSLFDTLYAPIAKGVTNGDAHDHSGGDGAQIAYASLSGTPDLAATYAPIAKGVTNGDSHDHSGGDGGTIAYASLSGTPSIPTQYTDEMAQDAVGAMVVDSATVGLAYVDATPTLTASVIDASITNAKLANMAEATVKGRAAAAGTGVPVDLTAAQLRTIANVADGADVTSAAGVGSVIHATTLDTTPLDADEVPGLDSSASFALVRWTWTSIKAFLKTYFDTLYELAGAIATHAALTATHGATGAIVGTQNTQTLTNKTLTTPILSLVTSATPAPTAEGVIEWDNNDDRLAIGDGVGTKVFSDDSKQVQLAGTQTITGAKTFASVTLTELLTLTPVSNTIAAGVLTPTGILVNVDTEGAAATDDLVTIAAGAQGQLIVLKSTADARDITIKHGTGNISCGTDRVLNEVQDLWFGVYYSTTWRQISFSDNFAPPVLEEGSWSPAITSSGTQPTMTYAIQDGSWWRQNKLYFYTIVISINTISVAGTGNLRISLPVACSAALISGDGTCRVAGVDLPGTPLYASFNPSAGQAYGHILTTVDNAVNATVAVTALANGDAIIISGQFIAA